MMKQETKEPNLLSIDPRNELKFEGPFNLPVTSWIRLTNNTDKSVYFKLKTTAPRRYCVRPNSGAISPKANVEVQVLLQPFPYNIAEKMKHKFMIQSVLMPEGSLKSPDELWKSVDPEKIMNYKLKCVFEFPATATQGNDKQEAQPEPVVQTAAPKAPKAPLSGLGGELQKAASEVKLLREEESKLRHENIILKEEIMRLRYNPVDSTRDSYSPPAVQQNGLDTSVPIYFIALSVGLAIFAFILGKFIL